MEILARRDPKTGRTQTLRAHTLAVADACETACAKIGLGALGRLTGLLHDSGKGADAFQTYLAEADPSKRGTVNHAACGARYAFEHFLTDDVPANIAAEWVIAAVCGHHGGLPDCTGSAGEDILRQRAYPQKECACGQALARFFKTCTLPEELSALFMRAVQETAQICGKTQAFCADLPGTSGYVQLWFMLGMIQRYLMSSLVDADRYDAYGFEAGAAPAKESDPTPLWETLAARLEAHLADLAEKAAEHPETAHINRKRREIADACLAFSEHSAGIFRLVVPTGGGKTYSSLRYALHCAAKAGKRRIFYVAPYKTILEQNAADIRDVLQQDDAVLEHHSDVVLDRNGSSSSREELERYELLTERWDAPVVLTTTVQFLNTLFDGRLSSVRRMHSLAGSVIILDEVQAMPVRCLHLFNAAANFLSCVMDCAVILCTATQPALENTTHPIRLRAQSDMVPDMDAVFAAFRRVRVEDKTRQGALGADQLADFAFSRAKQDGSLLAVLNTKSAAAKLCAALRARMNTLPDGEQIPVYFLSTSLCPAHRKDVIDEIRTRLKKHERLICVSTQLIEAGVDLSFACVIRSLAGLDSIAQAAGRCNRHGEAALRTVYIMQCADEDLRHLPDILAGQSAAKLVLEGFARAPQRYGGDLLSPDAIRQYYAFYFEMQKSQLDYPVALDRPTSLFDLLSVHTLARSACEENGRALPQHPLHQAYATAGSRFQVIDRQGIAVVAPYGDGEALIARLCGKPDLAALPALLRRTQRYAVNLFEQERRALETQGAIIYLPDCGVAVLREHFYDKTLGVQTRRHAMDTLIV
ncbi:CRISPR-associated helicase/endonuclease Cas3 [Ethanoligenens harbinense]|uniref:CRISPR-associated HD domain protein n=1 Tax=Ethanoligenens harbinense (strain DSM 18485 / JCM 12961 / CGMCC 1.5033 / YUAN-3) TaxID=663278 RepID=E6U9V6_ETHHY|nr:CRISPR-associated helicase/endonuclease Cas3 [Ethanoligenens harbinense]ADU26222.1 CRISPR-associated HD domain protein [Ethanoligenens harbinense YUAN-3]AVQ95358.1 CRISPR-associated helicase/endonuclease Cas3 [Ethanoligenens harbinense YUAN-3]AYF38024.1 CRISPR-associated helicase/endonuclease Cas3 [Ethanoligenens harbinense]AYF40769.1 CRISPR-associated helicase/endonuclease Cas3 [Ethanoligenens harbinense]QCN91600.1 CRISPR-associated helicase/endonuclease Cas3 [Ethanoligenens harbinense]